jgi:predicted amidohydrolase
MRVALAQLAPNDDPSANLGVILSCIESCAGDDLVVFPELFLPGYDLEHVRSRAVTLDSREVDAVCEAARRTTTNVILGLAERMPLGIANSAISIDAGGCLTGVYRKTHLFGAEKAAFVPGDELIPFTMSGCPIGIMICFDVEYPEVARTLACRGASLLITTSANMDPFGPDHELFARARALENHLPHVYVNRVGAEAGFTFPGGSMLVAPDGTAIVMAGDGPTLLRAAIPEAFIADRRTDYLAQLRPDLYVSALDRTWAG